MADRFDTHGDFSWFELMTRDVEGSKEFYKELIEWDFEEMPMQQGGTYTVLNVKGRGVGGIMPMPDRVPECVPTHWATYITVDDVDAVAKKAETLGATIIVPPTDIPNVGRFATFQDPQRAVINIIKYRAPAS
jgi:predicted enzyme related to lactoylglutathione lyase